MPWLPIRRHSRGNSRAAGSSEAPIRNSAQPRWTSVPPWAVMMFTMKPTMGITPAIAKKTAVSIQVKAGLAVTISRTEWGGSVSAGGRRTSPGSRG